MAIYSVLPQLVTVFIPDQTPTAQGGTGEMNVVSVQHLPCLFRFPKPDAGLTGEMRAELTALRELMWAPGYFLPEHSQVLDEATGQLWNVRPGTIRYRTGIGGIPMLCTALLVRVDA